MKPQSVARNVETFGLDAPTGFQIKATAKAFEILSSGLYKDKITAILREISANAYDAHTEAKIATTPISIHLPTTIAPYLSIRDFGAGLSPDRMEKVYQTYFASLKEDSDDYIGGLGLGSKSPFAYTDAYSVISRHGGRKITYDLFKNTHGEPTLAARSDEPLPADETTGLEVIVPVVSNSDVTEFARKARNVFEHYPVKPTFSGNRFEGVVKFETLLEGTGWRLIERDYDRYGRGSSNSRAIMGIIGYPIDPNQIISHDEEHGYKVFDATGIKGVSGDKAQTALLKRILTAPIDIDFNIGELDITAGREDLSYIKSTKAAILSRAAEVAAELELRVQSEFKACKNMLEAKRLYGKLFSYGSPLQTALGEKYIVKWNGVEITNTLFQIDMNEFPESRITLYRTSNRGSHKFTQDFRADPKRTDDDDDTSYYNARRTESSVFAFDATKEKVIVEFFYDDLDGAGHHSARIFKYRTETSGHPQVILLQTKTKADLNAFRRMLDGITIKPVSELPKPVYERGSYTKAKFKMLRRNNANDRHFSGPKDGPWSETDVVVEEGGIFVLSNRGRVVENSGNYDADAHFSAIYLMANKLGLLDVDEQIIAVPVSQSKSFTEVKKHEGKWHNFFDVIRERGKAALTKDVLALIVAGESRNSFREPCHMFRSLLTSLHVELQANHPITRFANLYLGDDKSNLWSTYNALAEFVGVVPKGKTNDFNQLWKSISDKYPMWSLAQHDYMRWDRPQIKILLDYINLIDQNTVND